MQAALNPSWFQRFTRSAISIFTRPLFSLNIPSSEMKWKDHQYCTELHLVIKRWPVLIRVPFYFFFFYASFLDFCSRFRSTYMHTFYDTFYWHWKKLIGSNSRLFSPNHWFTFHIETKRKHLFQWNVVSKVGRVAINSIKWTLNFTFQN